MQSDSYDDAPDIVHLRFSTGVVKRGRKCTLCGRTMPPGTRFELYAYLEDGSFHSDQTCIRLEDDWLCPLDTKMEVSNGE